MNHTRTCNTLVRLVPVRRERKSQFDGECRPRVLDRRALRVRLWQFLDVRDDLPVSLREDSGERASHRDLRTAAIARSTGSRSFGSCDRQ